jgi:hypothetical protein
VAGAAISKGHLLLSHHFSGRQYLLKFYWTYGYSITCGYYGLANFDINFEQFDSLHLAKGAKKNQ